jgi:hypothetical protein
MNKKPLTSFEFKKAIEEIAEKYCGNEEVCHAVMDDLLCDTLRSLGYQDGIDIFDSTEKWYA